MRQIVRNAWVVTASLIVLTTHPTAAQQAPLRSLKTEEVAAAVRAAPGAGEGVRLCHVSAYLQDRDPAGTNLRAGPGTTAAIVKRIPNQRKEGGERIAPEFEIIGAKDGWLLVRNIRWAGYDLKEALIHPGPVWISASLAMASIEGHDIREKPEPRSPLVMKLTSKNEDGEEVPGGEAMPKRVHGCSGSMLDVTLELPTKKSVRGWANGACANQVTTCGGGYILIYESAGRLVVQEE